MCEGLVFSLLEGEGWVVWVCGVNGIKDRMEKNVYYEGMCQVCVRTRLCCPQALGTRGHSLDDAFDELLHWASTDDADR